MLNSVRTILLATGNEKSVFTAVQSCPCQFTQRLEDLTVNISLSKFCKDTGLPKSSVYVRCQELGFSVGNGLTPEMLTTLENEFDVKAPVAGKVVVETGNHTTSKMVRVGVGAASLEQFRTTRDRQQLANPKQFMGEALEFLDAIEVGMDEAEAQQEQDLQDLRSTKKRVQKRVEKFRRRADEYRIKSDLMTQIQNTEMEDLEDLAGELSAMGKPALGGSSAQSPSESE